MENKRMNLKDLTPLAILAGLGIGGYFIWKKYFKKNGIINPEGFIISKISITQEGQEVQFPKRGTEFNIGIIARNKGEETIDGYSEIINLDTQETVFYEEAPSVPAKQVHTFTYTTIMPGANLNLITKTGRIIDSEKIEDYSWPLIITSQELKIINVGVRES